MEDARQIIVTWINGNISDAINAITADNVRECRAAADEFGADITGLLVLVIERKDLR